jgi:hypothetical protein
MQPSNDSQPDSTPAKSGDSCSSGSCCPLQKRTGLLFWGVLIFALLYMQWPMLKGMYYRATDSPAAADNIAWRSSVNQSRETPRQNQEIPYPTKNDSRSVPRDATAEVDGQ